MRIAILLYLTFHFGCINQIQAARGKVCAKKVHSYFREIHSRGAYPSDEISNDGKTTAVRKKNLQFEYSLYVETNCSNSLKFTSVTIDGKQYKMEEEDIESPVMMPGDDSRELIKYTKNNIVRLVVKQANPKDLPKMIGHKVIIKGTLWGKPFTLTDTAEKLPALMAQ